MDRGHSHNRPNNQPNLVQVLRGLFEFALDLIFPRISLDEALGESAWTQVEQQQIKDITVLYAQKGEIDQLSLPIQDISENVLFGKSGQTKEELSLSTFGSGRVQVWVATDYRVVRRLVLKVKYEREPYFANHLAELLWLKVRDSLRDNLRDNLDHSTLCAGRLPWPDLITYVPADPARLKQRGFHLPQILAKNLGTRLACRVGDLFLKLKSTPAQAGMGRVERLKNLSQAFELSLEGQMCLNPDQKTTTDRCSSGLILDPTPQTKSPDRQTCVWIIDDVIATGVTVFTLAELWLKKYPDTQVIVLVLARNTGID